MKKTKTKTKKAKPVAACPLCHAQLLEAAVKTAYSSATSQIFRGTDEEDIKVPASCCGKDWTYGQVKSLWGTVTSKKRKSFGAGTGRPTVERECPKGCGQSFSARKLRAHIPVCDGR